MSLYDDLGVETSDSKTEGWSKNFKLLQSQLQVKKAALTQAKVWSPLYFCFLLLKLLLCLEHRGKFVALEYRFGVIFLGFVYEFVARSLAKLRGGKARCIFLEVCERKSCKIKTELGTVCTASLKIF